MRRAINLTDGYVCLYRFGVNARAIAPSGTPSSGRVTCSRPRVVQLGAEFFCEVFGHADA